jgi:hypothetical protein
VLPRTCGWCRSVLADVHQTHAQEPDDNVSRSDAALDAASAADAQW